MARRRRTLTPTPRRRKVWADQTVTDLGFAEDALRSADLLADFATVGSTQGVTILRTIIQLVWSINELHTPAERLTVGLIKGTTTAADVADPITEEYADWAYLHTAWAGKGQSGSTAADAGNYIDLDVKSMRRVDEVGESWWLIFRGTAPLTATATYDVRARVRTLLLLP